MSVAWRITYPLLWIVAPLPSTLRRHFGRSEKAAPAAHLIKSRRCLVWPSAEVVLSNPREASTESARCLANLNPSSQCPLLSKDLVDIEDFLSRGFADRIGFVRERHKTAMRSAELAQIWSDLLEYLVANNASPNTLVPLARQTIVLNPTSPGANRAYELLCPARDTSRHIVMHMIISCQPRIHRALELRDRLVDRKDSTVVIVGREGAHPDTFEDGIMTVDAPDTYEELPKKVMEALSAVRRRFGALPVLKIDDDTAVVGRPCHSEIMAFMAKQQFAGELVGDQLFDRCWHFGKCSSSVFNVPYEKAFLGSWPRGTLYYLSSRAVDLLVKNYIFYPGTIKGEMFEDKMVSDILRSQGILPAQVDFGPVFGLAQTCTS